MYLLTLITKSAIGDGNLNYVLKKQQYDGTCNTYSHNQPEWREFT